MRLATANVGRIDHSPFRHPLFALGGWALVLVGQLQFAQRPQPAFAFAVWSTGLLLSALSLRAVCSTHDVEVLEDPLTPRTSWQSARTLVPASIAVASAVVSWRLQHTQPLDASGSTLMAIWVIGVVCAVAAVWQPVPAKTRSTIAAWWRRRRGEVALLAGLAFGGALLTVPRVASFPWTLNGDEGGFALISRSVLDGQIDNPFSVGYMSHPMLYNVLQAGAMRVVGQTVLGARLVPAIFGALSVPLVYLVTKRLTASRWAGIAAAVLLGTFHAHLYWSRSALPNVASIFFVLLVLYLLDRSLVDGGPATVLLTGVATGLAQYFYFSNRVLVPVVVVTLFAAALTAGITTRRWGTAVIVLGKRTALAAAGFCIAVVPLVAFFDEHPGKFNGRVNQVSLFYGDTLRNEAAFSGRSSLGVVWHHMVETTMLPFRSAPTGLYRPDTPSVGWLLAVAAAIGLALAIARVAQPRWVGLSVAYWGTVAGTAATVGPADTNRWVMAVPLVCVFAAVGLHGTVRVVADQWPSSRATMVALASLFVVVAATGSLHYFFRDGNQVQVYSDPNTQVAEHMAREINAFDPGATVYFSGEPRMNYFGFHDLVFRASRATGVDVVEPWTAAGPPPTLTGSTMFVALPERSAELDIIEQWYPVGTRRDTVDTNGVVMYSTYTVVPTAGG